MIGLVLAIFLSVLANGEIRFSMNSDNAKWYVYNANKSVQVDGHVPGGIYTDLQKAGKISQNLFYRFNDIEYRWVANDNWTYRTEFDLPPEILNKSSIRLVFHGIDTVAGLYLNGNFLGRAENMFVRYVFPVEEHVKRVNNTLEVRFKSPIVESRNLFEKYNYTVPPKCVPAHYNGECHVNFLRKMQASFAWDWGPAFPSVGLWKEVEIEAFDTAILRDITTKLEDVNATTWSINVTAYLEIANLDIDGYEVSGQISTEKSLVKASSYKNIVGSDGLVSFLRFTISKDCVKLWWPNGFGEQPLYEVSVTFRSRSEKSEKSVKIGIRWVELVQEKIRPSKEGLTFYLKINGLPIFAKGSNWIPSHILPESSYDQNRIRSLLLSAKEVHMNILRVWGGGLYESKLFYQIADELGIMIWQDMMYACSMYPTNKEFLDSVKMETVQQVRRLQHHPSIVLWAGNNENEAALRGNWYGTSSNFELYKADYVKLYVNTIKPRVQENDGTRPYVVSSPSNGIVSEKEGHIASDPYSPLYGDTHFYNYILDSWNSETYPYTRFASEYGFQSLPSMKTMSQVSLPTDRRLESQFSAKRQHLLAGYFLMAVQILARLPRPNNEDPEKYYSTFIYYSQIGQAMGVKTETEKYRRDRNRLTKKNEGRTMGAMYWQLNDVWQAPTWSSIDFSGRWKILHYYAKKFFSPVIVSPDITIDNYLNVFIISDAVNDIPEAEMNIFIYSWDSFQPKKVISSKEHIRGRKSKIHARYEFPQLLSESGCKATNCFVYLTLTSAEDDIRADNILYPTPFTKVTNLQPASIRVNATKTRENEISVELSTDRIAPFVWLETDESGQFSDNGFTLVQQRRILTFGNRNETVDVDAFKRSLTVTSLIGNPPQKSKGTLTKVAFSNFIYGQAHVGISQMNTIEGNIRSGRMKRTFLYGPCSSATETDTSCNVLLIFLFIKLEMCSP